VRKLLVDLEDEALEVLGLGEVEQDGVVVRGTAAFEQGDAAVGVNGGRGDDGFEFGEADVVGAGAGDEQSAGAEHFEGAEVELFIAAECALDGALAFGEGGRIDDDDVPVVFGFGPVAEELEGIGLDPVNRAGEQGAVGFQVALGDLKGGARGVDAGDLGADLGEVEGESSLVGADVKGLTGELQGAGPLGRGAVIFTLVKERAGFLPGVGIEEEAEAVEVERGGCLRGIGLGGEERCELGS